jgi:hypothetical protein
MGSLVRTKTISAEPVALADMKNFLKIQPNVTADDVLISGLIRAARQQAEIETNCALVRSTFVQYLDHFPYWRLRESGGFYAGQTGHFGNEYTGHQHHGEIKIRRPPLISVQSLVYIGTDGNPETLNPGEDFIVDVADQPGRIRPIPYTVWPLALHTPNAIAISFTAGYAPNAEGTAAGQTAISEPETGPQDLAATWAPEQTFAEYAYQTDQNGNLWIQTVSPGGTTGSNRPAFEAQPIGGTVTGDGSASWLNVGPVRGFWTPDTPYNGQNQWVILDNNSNLQLLIIPSLISQVSPPSNVIGSTPPPFSQTLGAVTEDNGFPAWRCLGLYIALGNQNAGVPAAENSPEQQASYVIDRTLPDTVSMAIMQLVGHWYFNREPVTPGPATEIPMHVRALLAGVAIHDYSPTPG